MPDKNTFFLQPNPETTVLCHHNKKGLFGVGMGQKVPDMFAAFGCSDCHGESSEHSEDEGNITPPGCGRSHLPKTSTVASGWGVTWPNSLPPDGPVRAMDPHRALGSARP